MLLTCSCGHSQGLPRRRRQRGQGRACLETALARLWAGCLVGITLSNDVARMTLALPTLGGNTQINLHVVKSQTGGYAGTYRLVADFVAYTDNHEFFPVALLEECEEYRHPHLIRSESILNHKTNKNDNRSCFCSEMVPFWCVLCAFSGGGKLTRRMVRKSPPDVWHKNGLCLTAVIGGAAQIWRNVHDAECV